VKILQYQVASFSIAISTRMLSCRFIALKTDAATRVFKNGDFGAILYVYDMMVTIWNIAS